jgi:vacuolar-type H+-ATPase subunit I/STV1
MDTQDKEMLSNIYSSINKGNDTLHEFILNTKLSLQNISKDIAQIQKENTDRESSCEKHNERTRKIEDFILKHDTQKQIEENPSNTIKKLNEIDNNLKITNNTETTVSKVYTSWKEMTAYIISLVLFIITLFQIFHK